jgi:hypothetical protein
VARRWDATWRRLGEVIQSVEQESFAPQARARLAEVDAELKAIGYDAAEHDARNAGAECGRPRSKRICVPWSVPRAPWRRWAEIASL